MKLFSELKRVASSMSAYPGAWALCGGVVASIYRQSPRFTADVDIAVVAWGGQTPEEIASQVLLSLGYQPIAGFIPNLSSGPDEPHALICGRAEGDDRFIGIDFLLPTFTWVPAAVARAQQNMVDYGFSKLPTVTVEDLLIAKLQALPNSERTQDLDDIRSILLEWKNLDQVYLKQQLVRLGVSTPEWFWGSLRSG